MFWGQLTQRKTFNFYVSFISDFEFLEASKQFLNLTLYAENSPFKPKKIQNDTDLGQKQKMKLKEAQEIKDFQLCQ